MEGIVFDIVEMTVNDGPGVRTTVFLKGCPLRCQWCHNPEGLSFRPQRMISSAGCTNCGACRRVCPSQDACIACGECTKVCPAHLRRIAGTAYQPEELAALPVDGTVVLSLKKIAASKDVAERPWHNAMAMASAASSGLGMAGSFKSRLVMSII